MQDDGKRGQSSRKHIPLAPKDDQVPSASSSRSGRASASTAVTPKNRLPPRSRTGCWTCRTRKVKCDEGRPVCGQCSRLGHACDYHPRLSFRDDTSRVKERMPEVAVAGSIVWDCSFPICNYWRNTDSGLVAVTSPAPSSAGSTVDDLAPFANLLTDEDRERKAEASIPGKYHVIVNPESFQHLAEYLTEDSDSRRNGGPPRRASLATSLASSFSRDSNFEAISVPGDPNVVILPRFEDLSRRSTRELKSPTSPTATNRPHIKREESDCLFPIRSPEITTLRRFRDVVWKQLVPPEHGPDSSIVLLDEAAAQFPPVCPYVQLFYIMLILVTADSHDDVRGISRHLSAGWEGKVRFLTALLTDLARTV